MRLLLLTCCIFLSSISLLNAQSTFQSKKFSNTFRLTEVLLLDNGFVVLGHREREERIGNTIETHYEPFLAELDLQLNTVWETKFPESRHPTFQSLVASNDAYYMNGNYHGKDSKHSAAQFVKVSKSGNVEFKKQYSFPGYHSVEGFQLLALPDGDLIVANRTYRNFNSFGTPWLIRLRPDGQQVWDQHFGQNHYQSMPNKMTLSADGNVLLFGAVYDNKEDFKNSNAAGWVCAFNPDAPQKMLVDNIFRQHRNFIFKDAVQLMDGGWWVLGDAPNSEKKRKVGVLSHYDSNWNLSKEKEIDLPKGVSMLSGCWNDAKEQFEMVGFTGQHPSWQGILVSVDLDWNIVSSETGETGISLQVESLGNGNLVMLHQDQINLVR